MTDPAAACHCTDYSRAQVLRAGLAEAGRGLRSIERGMPVPAGTGLTRRNFVARASGLALAVFGARGLVPDAFQAGIEAAAADGPGPVLVSIFLSGGADSLSLLAPIGDPAYAALRPNLALQPSGDPIDVFAEDTRLHWHPSARPLRDLYRAGKLTVIPAIGYDDPNQSHFTSRHYWEVGALDPFGRTGWLGRYLDRHGAPDNPLQGLSLDSSLAPSLAPLDVPVAAVSQPENYSLWFRDVWDSPIVDGARAAWGGLGGLSTADVELATARRATSQTVGLGAQLAPLQGRSAPWQQTVAYPSGWFPQRLAVLAEMLSLGMPLRVVALDASGGYDTHDNQVAALDSNFSVLSASLAAFQADLAARGLADRVLVHVWSEFGRRPRENGTGTDHGAGGISFLLGTRARGEMVGEFPGLAALDPQQNLRHTVDFRAVYCSLLEQWLGVGAEGIVPGASGLARPALVA